MSTSVREYAILYTGRRRAAGGGSIALGGNALLNAGQHALDGPEHSGASDSARLDASTDAHGLMPKLDGIARHFFNGEGGWSGFDLGWFNVEDYGAVHDGTTDDTAAIQAAIDACYAAGGGTIFFPQGNYQIAGPLVSTGTYNSQLTIPQNTLGVPGVSPLAIRFLGSGPSHPITASFTGAVLRSTWNGTISGTPAIISAGAHDTLLASFNWVFVSFENITIQAHDDPKLTAIDMTAAASLRWEQLTVGITPAGSYVVPTHSNAVAVDMPWGQNSQPHDGGDGLYIDSFYIGLRPSEQCAAGQVSISRCTEGIHFRGQQGTPGYLRHATSIDKVAFFFTKKVLVFSGDQRWVQIGLIDIEHDLAPFDTTYDIDDASNYGRGFIGWHTNEYSPGPSDGLLVNGGSGLSLHGFYAKRWRLANAVDIPIGTNPSTNPTNGRRVYADSATGHLSARTPAGAVIDYETLAPTGAAGGDLTGTYPNPTVVASHSGSTHAATQAAAEATAAAALAAHVASSGSGSGDHEHVIDVFNGDASTTAFELSNEPVDPEQVFAFVGGSWTAVTMSGAMNTTATFGSAPGSGTGNVVIQYPAVAA